MAAIDPSAGEILGVASTDVLELYRGDKREVKRVTVGELLRGPGLVPIVPAWDDLLFGASGINVLGAAGAATRDQNTGLISFAGNADNVLAGSAQLPHRWLTSSVVRPHLHLRFPTANAGKNTKWKFEYDCANINDVFANDYGTYTTLATITVANPDNVRKSVVASFGDLDMAGYGISACIAWRITRLAGTDSEDDDTNAVILTDFDIHFQSDSAGSATEFSK